MRLAPLLLLMSVACAELVVNQGLDDSSASVISSDGVISRQSSTEQSASSGSSDYPGSLSSAVVVSSLSSSVAHSSSSASSEASTPAPFIQYWNTLGSADELSSSRVGFLSLSWGNEVKFVQGVFGGAISNDRPGLYSARAVLPYPIFLLSRFTCEFWIKKDADGVNLDSAKGLILSMNHSGQAVQFQHCMGINGEYLTRVHLESDGVIVKYCIQHTNIDGCNEFLPPGGWVHIAIVSHATGQPGRRIRLYRDGIEQQMTVETDGVLPPEVANMSGIYLLSSSKENDQGFAGCMDNIKIYANQKYTFSLEVE